MIGGPASGAGTAGQYTRKGGFLAYYEVEKFTLVNILFHLDFPLLSIYCKGIMEYAIFITDQRLCFPYTNTVQ